MRGLKAVKMHGGGCGTDAAYTSNDNLIIFLMQLLNNLFDQPQDNTMSAAGTQVMVSQFFRSFLYNCH